MAGSEIANQRTKYPKGGTIYGVGLGNVGSYQVSGKPFLTSSVVEASHSTNRTKIKFPAVTKQITLSCSGTADGTDMVRVAMSSHGMRNGDDSRTGQGKYFLLHGHNNGGGYLTLDIKCTELYLMSNNASTPTVSVYASLTSIDPARIDNISPTGSNWSGSAGI